jgi:hypothetical protein
MFAAYPQQIVIAGRASLLLGATALSTRVKHTRGCSAPMCYGAKRHRDGTATPWKRPRGKTLFWGFSVRLERTRLELSDEADLGMQMVAELLAHRRLSDRDQLANVLRGRAAEVNQDVRVHV